MFKQYHNYRLKEFMKFDYLRTDFSLDNQDEIYYSATVRVEDPEGNDRWIPIKKVSANELPEGVLGMTNHREILIRNDLDPFWTKKVIEHEKAHIRHPDKHEHEIRELTNTREPMKFYRRF